MTTEELYEVFLSHPLVSTDSRHCPEGCMFFALKGASFDGNRFAAKALESGAAVAVVDDAAVVPEGALLTAADGAGCYVLVDDVLTTLQQLAALHRRHFHGPVLQVTGTNGKTTTKELLAAVLSRRFRVLYTQGNLNNHIGVPLTLLRLRTPELAARHGGEAHEMAVIETGANHPGEIALLAGIVDPDYGLVTNVGRAHLEGFGSFEGVKRTKGELYDYLHRKSGGRIFVCESNFDLQDMLVERDIDVDTDECITYAREQALTTTWICEGDVVACNPLLSLWWRPKYGAQRTVTTRLIGAYNLDNVLAAVAVGLHFDVAPDDISAALEAYQPSLGRSEFRQTERNRLIVDAYNANLTSMLAALGGFKALESEDKMLILGDMKELGTASEDAHRQVLRMALESGAGMLWLVGPEFAKALQAEAPAGDPDIRCFPDVAAVEEAISRERPCGRLILIKGSNSTGLHRLPPLL